jgi:hypothetical protein
LYIARSKGGVDKGGESDKTGDVEVVGELAAELATTCGGIDSNNAADTTIGKGKLSRTNRPTGICFKLRAAIDRKSVESTSKASVLN